MTAAVRSLTMPQLGSMWTRKIFSLTWLRTIEQTRRSAIRTYFNPVYPGYVNLDGAGFPDTRVVCADLACGMNLSPDHVRENPVSTPIRRPVLDTIDCAYLNNPVEDSNGIPTSGKPLTRLKTSVRTQYVTLAHSATDCARSSSGASYTTLHHIASALGSGADGKLSMIGGLMGDVLACLNDSKR